MSEVSPAAKKRAIATRMFLESYFRDVNRKLAHRTLREYDLQKKLSDPSITDSEKQALIEEFRAMETEYLRSSRKALQLTDFENIKLVGRGGFGEVRLVRHLATNKLLAIKLLSKSNIVKRGFQASVMAEREIMSHYSPFLVHLHASFTTPQYLCLVLDYCPGGDLMGKLIRDNIFSETETKFYAAEILLALETLHKVGYMHRDIKPDNILIDRDGHLKLCDFGLASAGDAPKRPAEVYAQMLAERMAEDPNFDVVNPTAPPPVDAKAKRLRAKSIVGTPDFTCPEVLLRKRYSNAADFLEFRMYYFRMFVWICTFLCAKFIGNV
ncbi:hypothetical protein GEMRC1_002133 [Eukaryota sp. GEM-RC1]